MLHYRHAPGLGEAVEGNAFWSWEHAVVSDFVLAHAAGTSAQALAAACSDQLRGAEGHAFGFVYATSPLALAFPAPWGLCRKCSASSSGASGAQRRKNAAS